MAVADNAYSRLIFWLKVLLPLVALAILSTLFLIARTLDPNAAIPYADVDVEKILREQGITKPTFGGVTADGVGIYIAADSVRPGQGDRQRLTSTTLEAKLDLPDGGQIDIASPEGIVDVTTRQAILQGGARLESSTGFVVETDRLTTAFDAAMAESDGPVTATGPAGDLSAGRMVLSQNESGGYVLVFQDGVRLIYKPKPE